MFEDTELVYNRPKLTSSSSALNNSSSSITIAGTGTGHCTGIGANLCWTGTNIGWTVTPDQLTIADVFSYLNEKELEDILDKILERMEDYGKKGTLLTSIIRARHFSEDFIVKYLEFVNIEDIKVQHISEIRTGNYPRVSLYIEGSK